MAIRRRHGTFIYSIQAQQRTWQTVNGFSGLDCSYAVLALELSVDSLWWQYTFTTIIRENSQNMTKKSMLTVL